MLWKRAWQPTPVFLPGESPWTEEPAVHGVSKSGTRLRTAHSTCIVLKTGSLLGWSSILTAKIDQGTVSRIADHWSRGPWGCSALLLFLSSTILMLQGRAVFLYFAALVYFYQMQENTCWNEDSFPSSVFPVWPQKAFESVVLPRHVLWFSQTRCGPAPVSVNEVYRHKATST